MGTNAQLGWCKLLQKGCAYSEDFRLEKGVNNVFSNQFGILGLLETWSLLDEQFEVAVVFVFCFLVTLLWTKKKRDFS